MKLGYLLLMLFGFTLGATCAFKNAQQFPIPPQDIDFKIMARNATRETTSSVCGVSPNFNTKDIDIVAGERIFKLNCASCHNRNMKDDLTGPALGKTLQNWKEYPREDLYNWIRNSQKMIEQGHPRASQLWTNWQSTVMNSFDLTDEEIEQILNYIEVIASY